MRIGLGQELRVAALRVSQAYVYEGKGESRTRTEARVVNELGQPVTRVGGLSVVGGEETVDVTVELTDAQAEGLKPDNVIHLTGQLVADIKGGDYGSVRAVISGVESVSVVATIAEALASAGRRGARSAD